jgi:hypothetical protein
MMVLALALALVLLLLRALATRLLRLLTEIIVIRAALADEGARRSP